MLDLWIYLLLFIFGTAIGSFLNVVILRYDPDKKLFAGTNGRSHCMSCGKNLHWYELIPLVSFIIQLGRCRSCKARLSWQYPVVEFIAGAIFVLVPYVLLPIGLINASYAVYLPVILWTLVFITLLLISVIDFHLYIIPDGLNVAIFIFAAVNFINLYLIGNFGELQNNLYHSLLGTHAGIAGTLLGTKAAFLMFMSQNIWLNFILGGVFGGAFFGAIYFLSRGRAMGFGDVKLALAAGFLLGLPDMILATILAFITGALAGLFLMIRRKKGIKDHLPFGPFIALGITFVFFFGYDIVDGYFKFFSFLE